MDHELSTASLYYRYFCEYASHPTILDSIPRGPNPSWTKATKIVEMFQDPTANKRPIFHLPLHAPPSARTCSKRTTSVLRKTWQMVYGSRFLLGGFITVIVVVCINHEFCWFVFHAILQWCFAAQRLKDKGKRPISGTNQKAPLLKSQSAQSKKPCQTHLDIFKTLSLLYKAFISTST